MPVISQENIGKDEELSHDGDERDLGGLSGFDECLVIGGQIRAGVEGEVLRAYDADSLSDKIEAQGGVVVVPPDYDLNVGRRFLRL